jgi:CheY-like chemotaxis protein
MPDAVFEHFAFNARERLAEWPGTLAIIELPASRLDDACVAFRSRLRRLDEVAAYDATHAAVLLVDLPPAIARERIADMIMRLGPGDPPRFHAGLASSAAGASDFETLMNDAFAACASARAAGVLVAVAGEAAPVPAAPGEHSGTVVIADDDPEVLRLIDAQVRAAGYKTVLAADGQQALSAIEQHAPDLAIVDMMMPRVTGVDVLAALRSRPVRPRVIVLSARGREQDITRAFALGADDYVTKPFSPQELLARMERLLRQGTRDR